MVANLSSGPRLRIFISYGHDEHSNFAQKMKEDFIARGHEVWFDLDKLKPGMEWERYIEEGLNWASKDGNGRIILIMTPHSVRRPDGFCLNELARALSKSLKVIPILLVWCEPPLSICRIQQLDMQDCLPLEDRKEKYEVKFDRLLEALEHNRLDFEGYQSNLFNVLDPLSFDSEVRYYLDKFTGRDWVFEAVDRWLEDAKASRLFWISGGPGVGKTAISSYLAAHRPEIVAFHFCRYDNVQKRDPRRVVMSLAYQLSTQLHEYAERLGRVNLDSLDGQDAKTLFDHLIVQPLAANYPKPERGIVVLIDALDEATVDGKNELAGFIASGLDRLPPWLRLIITSRPNPEVMGPLRAYTPFIIDISDPRNDRDIKDYLARELGRLKPGLKPQAVEAVAKKCDGLFLYAEWIVSEIGRGRLSLNRLDEFPQGLGGIYLNFFDRQFPDIKEWEERVAPAMDVVAAAQEPLSLGTVAHIFGWNQREERRFRHSLGALFSFDHGVQPFHKSIIEWLSDEDKQEPYFVSAAEGHKLLAEYLWKEYRSDRWSSYLVSYILIHLCAAERWAELEEVLQDMKFVRDAWKIGMFRFMGQWSFIEEKSPLRMADLYCRMDLAAKVAEDDRGLLAVLEILSLTSIKDTGLKLSEFLARHYRETNELQKLSEVLDHYYSLLIFGGELQKALAITKENESICRKLGDKHHLLRALIDQYTYVISGDFTQATSSMAEEIESLLKEINDVDKFLWYLSGKTIVLLFRDNDLDAALAVTQEQEKIARDNGHLYWVAGSLINRGTVYSYKGDYNKALLVYQEATRIGRLIGSKIVLSCNLTNEGEALEYLGRLDEAMVVLLDAEKIIREDNVITYLPANLRVQGRVFAKKGLFKEAFSRFDEAERLCRDSGYWASLVEVLCDRAMALNQSGDSDRAMTILKEAEMICCEHGLKRNLEICLEKQKSVLVISQISTN